MQELSKYGMTLRWPEEIGVSERKVLVEAEPVSRTHVLNIAYSVNGGPHRMCRGWPVDINREKGFQTFAALLPEFSPREKFEWWPVLSNGIHELAPENGPRPSSSEKQSTAPQSDTSGRTFPYEMEYLARVTAPLGKSPTKIGETPEGLMIAFPLGGGGTVRGPKLNGEIEHLGGDWMRVRPDGVGISQIRVIVNCDDGTKFLGEYGGVVNFGRDGYAALSRGGGPKMAEVQLAPRFISADPKLDWLNRVQCLGLGRVTMSDLLVEYDLYAARSHAIPHNGDCNA